MSEQLGKGVEVMRGDMPSTQLGKMSFHGNRGDCARAQALQGRLRSRFYEG